MKQEKKIKLTSELSPLNMHSFMCRTPFHLNEKRNKHLNKKKVPFILHLIGSTKRFYYVTNSQHTAWTWTHSANSLRQTEFTKVVYEVSMVFHKQTFCSACAEPRVSMCVSECLLVCALNTNAMLNALERFHSVIPKESTEQIINIVLYYYFFFSIYFWFTD